MCNDEPRATCRAGCVCRVCRFAPVCKSAATDFADADDPTGRERSISEQSRRRPGFVCLTVFSVFNSAPCICFPLFFHFCPDGSSSSPPPPPQVNSVSACKTKVATSNIIIPRAPPNDPIQTNSNQHNQLISSPEFKRKANDQTPRRVNPSPDGRKYK